MSSRNVTCFRDFHLSPLVGVFDARTQDGEVNFQDYRFVLNMAMTDQRRRCRMGGWRQYGRSSPFGFKNQDMHDHMLDCLFYYPSYEEDVIYGGETVGYAYPYWEPYSEGYTIHEELDTFCGYAPDFYGVYPIAPQDGVRFICDSFVGYPYVIQPQSSAGTLSYADFDSTFGPPGQDPNWNGKQIDRGLAYLNNLEATYGPSQAITDARHFLNNIYEPAIDQWTDPRGEFSGSYGVIQYTYYLEYHLSFPDEPDYQEWVSGFTITGPGMTVYAECNSGAPDYFKTSYFDLCRDTIYGASGGEGYGPKMPVLSPITSYSREYCGDSLLTRDGCREPITLLFEAVTVSSRRYLIAGTRSRLAVLNERGGNWRILADGLGGPFDTDDNCTCSAVRFKAAQLGNYVIFVNGVNPVMYWLVGEGPSGCELWSAHPIFELEELGISTAKIVASWHGFVFIANVIQDAERHPYRVFWSDFNAPLSWAPGGESLAGFQDLGAGEEIVAMEPIGGQLRVYTKKGDQKIIYEVALIGGVEQGVFSFREIYRGPDGIEFENSLVNTGKAHFFLGSSGLFVIGEYERVPRRLEWMHKSTSVIYKGVESETLKDFDGLSPFGAINEDACDQAIGGFDSERKAIWFSWPTGTNVCANMSLVFFPEFFAASLVDHGFTAFLTHRPDYAMALRDFLAEFAGCYPGQFLDAKEGDPYTFDYQPPMPAYLRNETEDPNLPVHPNSLCARLDGKTIEELCRGCDANSEFLMASATDFTIKQFTADSYYRERYVVASDTPAYCPRTSSGAFAEDGYYSMIQGDSSDYGKREEKLINYSAIDFDAVEQAVPNLLHFQVAYGPQPSCMRWADTTPRELRCLTADTEAEHEANNTRAATAATYPMYRAGIFLAWRFYINGTGGGSCFNKVSLRVRTKSGIWI